MRTPYEWLIGTRYLRSTHRRGFVSFVALVSVLGLALGVATLIVVLSVMNGFQREIRSRILSVTSHATMMGIEGNLSDWQTVQREALQATWCRGGRPLHRGAGDARQRRAYRWQRPCAASCRNEEKTRRRPRPTRDRRQVRRSQAGEYNIILGSALAKDLNVNVGGTVVLIAPDGTATPTGVVPRMRRFTVVGIFESGMYEIDRGLALVHMTDAGAPVSAG